MVAIGALEGLLGAGVFVRLDFAAAFETAVRGFAFGFVDGGSDVLGGGVGRLANVVFQRGVGGEIAEIVDVGFGGGAVGF